jgi:hypothetical protein
MASRVSCLSSNLFLRPLLPVVETVPFSIRPSNLAVEAVLPFSHLYRTRLCVTVATV